MNKYQFLEDRYSSPIIISCGQLGACQLLSNRQTKQPCILKLAPKSQAQKDVQCLTQMSHPNIIKILDYFYHQQNILIIFQLLRGGDLYSKIKCKQIKSKHIAPIFKGICFGIHYIHSRKVIHRNLKTQTILLDQNFNPKIVDFGLAAKIGTRKTFCGCCCYMAPEILLGQSYNEKVDIWALGVILYEMIYGEQPFQGETPTDILNSIKKSKIFQGEVQPGSYDELIRQMLSSNPLKRPSTSQLLTHPLFTNVQPLSFLAQMQKTTKRRLRQQGIKPKHSLQRIKDKKQVRKASLVSRNNKNQLSLFDKLQNIVENKLAAFKDREKIEGNSHYNYVVSPL